MSGKLCKFITQNTVLFLLVGVDVHESGMITFSGKVGVGQKSRGRRSSWRGLGMINREIGQNESMGIGLAMMENAMYNDIVQLAMVMVTVVGEGAGTMELDQIFGSEVGGLEAGGTDEVSFINHSGS